MSVRTEPATWDTIAAEWRALWDATQPPAGPFVTPEFQIGWWEAFGDDRELDLSAVYEDDTLIRRDAAPARRRRRSLRRRLRGLRLHGRPQRGRQGRAGRRRFAGSARRPADGARRSARPGGRLHDSCSAAGQSGVPRLVGDLGDGSGLPRDSAPRRLGVLRLRPAQALPPRGPAQAPQSARRQGRR